MDNCAEKTEGWDFFKGRGFSAGHFCIGSKKSAVSLPAFFCLQTAVYQHPENTRRQNGQHLRWAVPVISVNGGQNAEADVALSAPALEQVPGLCVLPRAVLYAQTCTERHATSCAYKPEETKG